MQNPDPVFAELANRMEERSRKTLERFGQTSIMGVSHPKLLTILADVKAYWKDNFRPALASFSCEAVGGSPEAAEDASLMITLMGAGLGIHDDIIDKSTNKHFRTTILGSYGINNALLIGELFIVKALTTVREIAAKAQNPVEVSNFLDEYERFFLEIWEGEFMETLCRKNLETELKQYERVLWMSTADIEACTKLGAILGGGSKTEIKALSEVGRHLGFVLRLGDEVKDSLNIEGNLPSRLENESVPYPILFASKSSKEAYSKIKSVLDQPVVSPLDVRKILEMCFEAEAFSHMLKIANQNAAEAIDKLSLLQKSEAQNALVMLIENALKNIEGLSR